MSVGVSVEGALGNVVGLMMGYPRIFLETFFSKKNVQDAWPACAFCGVEDMLHNFLFKPHNMIILFSNASSVARVFIRHTYVRHVLTTCNTCHTSSVLVFHHTDTQI